MIPLKAWLVRSSSITAYTHCYSFPRLPVFNNNNNMRSFSASTLLAMLIHPSTSWQSAIIPRRTSISNRRLFMGTASPPASSSETNKVLTEGAIVSQFPGGMVAVRVQDDPVRSVTRSPVTTATIDPAAVPITQKTSKQSPTASTTGDYLGKSVLFPDGTTGVVVAHRPPLVFCYTQSPIKTLVDGTVQLLSNMVTIPECLDSAVDCFGRSLDNDEGTSVVTTSSSTPDNVKSSDGHALFHPIPKISDIALINTPLLTGITILDTLAPIGRGQNMLLIGHDINSMRGIAVDFCQAQQQNTKCVYVSTENASVARQRLSDASVLSKVCFVGMRDQKQLDKTDDPVSKAAEAVTAASAGCAIAESHAKRGHHTLVVIDTMDLHKQFWDATTRTLVDVFGVHSVVQSDLSGSASSELRGFYSSLIQRAGQYKARKGGGSVTLLLMTVIPQVLDTDSSNKVYEPSDFDERVRDRLNLLVQRNIPLTAANLRKVNIPIPSSSEGARRVALQHVDDLMSMSDGQIWLDERLEAKGQAPPMDPTRSLTRIGIGADTQSRADAPALRRIAEGLRLELAQAASLDGAEATMASKKQANRQLALLLSMHQKAGRGGRRLSESCVALLAAKEGFLDDAVGKGAVAGTEAGDKLMDRLLLHAAKSASGAMAEIDTSLDMNPEAKQELAASINSFFSS